MSAMREYLDAIEDYRYWKARITAGESALESCLDDLAAECERKLLVVLHEAASADPRAMLTAMSAGWR